jgi:lipopolysaccharide biosynthesis regulator YciM
VFAEILQSQLREHALSLAVILMTTILVYYYLLDRGQGIKLSQRYRKSIYELQSKLFLNASQYLISGQKDMAIQELMNAAEVSKETLETYFALGKLYRSNGEIDKATSIHRGLIARASISEASRLQALKELAVDYDAGGMVDKAIETYKDVLTLNREQTDVIKALCRIYEDIADWNEALNYRRMLSKMSSENQSDTISHILVEKSKELFSKHQIKEAMECLDEAFRFSPSVSARIQKIKISLFNGDFEQAQSDLLELLKEYPLYASFIFVAMDDVPSNDEFSSYRHRSLLLKHFFLAVKDSEFMGDPSILLSKVRLLKSHDRKADALDLVEAWQKNAPLKGDAMKMEYIQLLIGEGRSEQALLETKKFLGALQGTSTRHYCAECGFNSDEVFWRCPQCHRWETIQFRWKI